MELPPFAAGYTVLLVDDDATAREPLCKFLKIKNINVYEVSGGEEALALLENVAVDLVLSDLDMLPNDGLHLFAEMSKKGIFAPFVLMTARKSFTIAQEALRLGVKDYLVKPFSLEELYRVLCRLLPSEPVAQSRSIWEEESDGSAEGIFGEYEAAAASLEPLAHSLDRYLGALAEKDQMINAVLEAAQNVIEHSGADKYSVAITKRRLYRPQGTTPYHGLEAYACIKDSGQGFSVEGYSEGIHATSSKLGFYLIKKWVDHMSVRTAHGGGTQVDLWKCF